MVLIRFVLFGALSMSICPRVFSPGLPPRPSVEISSPLPAFPRSSALTMLHAGDRLRLARIIARVEGFYDESTLPYRLNNPGALVYARQPGAVPTEFDGLAAFDTQADGWRALDDDIRAKARKGLDAEGIIRARRGPDTDVVLYLQLVESILGSQ